MGSGLWEEVYGKWFMERCTSPKLESYRFYPAWREMILSLEGEGKSFLYKICDIFRKGDE